MPWRGCRDTLWILKGLLVSGMSVTAEGMVRNLASLLQIHGHVPNGARSYYLNRSQPPLLSAMVKLLRGASADSGLLLDIYPVTARHPGPSPWPLTLAPHPGDWPAPLPSGPPAIRPLGYPTTVPDVRVGAGE